MIRIIFDTAYHAVLDVDNLIRLIGYAALVGYDDDGHARFVQVLQNLHNLYGSFAVEGAGRFVGKDNLGLGNQRTGNGDTLLLSAGHLIGHVVRPVFQSQTLQLLQCHGIALPAAYALIEERESYILYRILKGNQVE